MSTSVRPSEVNSPSRRLAVVFGGPSPEHDVSILTGLQVARELSVAGREVLALYWSKAGEWFSVDPAMEAAGFLDGVPRGSEHVRLVIGERGGFEVPAGRLGRPKSLSVDVVVNCCHGGPGEDGSLQGALDLAGLPYTGPSVQGAAVGQDKLVFAAAVSSAGLPALPRALLAQGRGDPGFDGPYIVKPRFGGSSIGIEVVADIETARARLVANPHLRYGAVVEPYRTELFDLNIAVRTWPVTELSAIERPVRTTTGSEILGYADKYVGGEGMASAPRQLPAELPDALAGELREAALLVADVAGVRGVARVDFLSDGESLFVNEVNTIPGSLARYLWVDPPLGFGDLISGLVAEALSRPTAHQNAAGADGTVLRSAGSIAAKLA